LSEYYKLRRTRITDGMALIGFLIGFIAPAYSAGKRLVEGFESGAETGGLANFVLSILGNALLGGLVGLICGAIIAWLWERVHRKTRSRRDRATATNQVADTSGGPKPGGAISASSGQQTARPTQRPEGIRFDHTGVKAGDFLELISEIAPGSYDEERARMAMLRTVNIGAWDDGRLVGAVRVLTDGYFFATVPELLVHPECRRRGIGRELMQRALHEAPAGVIVFAAPPDSSGFFERLGCQRAPSGYVYRRKPAPAITSR
jgi:ribosomal protein S18 acetylase RimI-like enzyme